MTLQRFGPIGQPEDYSIISVAIAANDSLSSVVDLLGIIPVRIDMPSEWTAANLTVQVSTDNGTFLNLYDGSSEYTLTVAASRAVLIAPQDGIAIQRYIKIRSGTSGTPVNQGAARTLTLVCRKI